MLNLKAPYFFLSLLPLAYQMNSCIFFGSQLQLDERLSGLLESIAGSFRRDFVYRNINFPQIASAACNSLIVETFEAFEAGGRRPWFWFRATLLAPAVRHGCTSTAAVLLYRALRVRLCGLGVWPRVVRVGLT